MLMLNDNMLNDNVENDKQVTKFKELGAQIAITFILYVAFSIKCYFIDF